MMSFLSGFSAELILAIMAVITTASAFLFGGRRERKKRELKDAENYRETRKRMDEYARDNDDLSVADRLRKHSE